MKQIIKIKNGGTLVYPYHIKYALQVNLDGSKNPAPAEDIDMLSITYPPLPDSIVNTSVEKVKKFFEIFDVEIQRDDSVATWGVFPTNDFLVLLVTRYDPESYEIDELISNDPIYKNYKRLMWYEKYALEGILPQGYTHPWTKFSVLYYDEWVSSDDSFSCDIAHEIGHSFGLKHRGDNTNRTPNGNITEIRDNYYNISPKINYEWVPIMGAGQDYSQPVAQWSNGDYINAYPSQRNGPRGGLGIGDDIKMISLRASLIKKPVTLSKDNFNNQKPWAPNEAPFPKKDKKIARILTDTNDTEKTGGTAWLGMIGYPYDYDICKILLKAGTYEFAIYPDSINETPTPNLAMLSPRLELLLCNSELDKQKENINMDDSGFSDLNFNNAPYASLKTAKIGITNEVKYTFLSTPSNTNNMYFNLPYTTMVYLRVCGNYGVPVDKDEKPSAAYFGYSRYGSVGKYILLMDGDKPLLKSSNTIPNGHAEQFTVCIKGQSETVFLFVQDEKDPVGNGDPLGLNVKEFNVIDNGEIKSKKFLVYGQPINKDAKEEPDKYYLIVSVNGVCMKQEFIVGMGLDEDN